MLKYGPEMFSSPGKVLVLRKLIVQDRDGIGKMMTTLLEWVPLEITLIMLPMEDFL